jgi:hypothetical protein
MDQQYFTEEEWTLLRDAPTQVAIAVILADKSDPVMFLQETYAAAQILLEEEQRALEGLSDLVRAVIESMREAGASGATNPGLPNASPIDLKQLEILIKIRSLESAKKGRQDAIAYADRASEILASKVTIVQAKEFDKWLINIATRVAESVKEKGFLGLGGEWISEEEQSVIRKLKKALEYRK